MKTGLIRVLGLAALAMLLVACGGSSGTTPTTPTAATEVISGTAARGAAIEGMVTVIAADGTTVSVTIGAGGSFEVEVTGLSGPFMLKAQPSNGSDPVLFSYAAAAGVVANITPLTHLALYMANSNADPASLFDSWAAQAADLTAQIRTQQAIIKANLEAQGLLSGNGLANGIDFFTEAFSANSQGLDAVLDAVSVDLSSGINIAIANVANFAFNSQIATNGFEFNTSLGDNSGSGGSGAIADGEFGLVFKADGTQFTRTVTTPIQSGIALAITGLGDERYLAFNGSGILDQLRMLPINQTGTFVCGQGPNSFRLVEIWLGLENGLHKADVNGGSCTINVATTGSIYSGTFSGVVVSGDSQVIISEGEFRVDGSSL